MDLPVFVLAVCVMALTAACSGSSTGAAKRSLSSPVLACAGVSARVPAGWHGRTRIGNGGFFTLTLASFPLVAESDDVDEQSAKRMSRGDVLVLLLGYGREQAGDSPFQTNVRLPLTVQRMRVYGQFEHLPRGHRLARVLFVADGAAYDHRCSSPRGLRHSSGARRTAPFRFSASASRHRRHASEHAASWQTPLVVPARPVVKSFACASVSE